MRQPLFSVALAVLVVAASVAYWGCSSDDRVSDAVSGPLEGQTAVPAGSMSDRTYDDLLAEVSKRVPGFGGIYKTDDGALEVVMTDRAQAPAVEGALREVFPMDNVEYSAVRVRQGKYTFGQLKSWNDGVYRDVLAMNGVVYTDIDERANRLRIGISDASVRSRVEQTLARSEVPLDAFDVEMTTPVNPELRLRRRPLVGGLQIHWSNFLCTLGFIANRAGVRGFVTNSHCSGLQGGVQGTIYHQHLASGTTNRVGLETADPVYFVGGVCPATRRCRYSDAAFARVPHPSGPATTSTLGRIARTAIGSFAWNGVSFYFILGKQVPTFLGEAVQRTGRTTGTRTGRVIGTCVNANVSGGNVTLLCQAQANYISDGGDSGSPIYRVINPAVFSVALMGVHWGSSVSGPVAGTRWFSKIERIDAELGALTVN